MSAYADLKRQIVTEGNREHGQCGAAQTGTIAAGLTAGSAIWTYRYPEAAPAKKRICVQRLICQTVNVAAFTVPATPGRGLKLVRGTAPANTADPTGGNAWTPTRKRFAGSETLGVGRVATTGALTTTGFTLETSAPFAILSMPFGTAGGSITPVTFVFEDPPILAPGELLAWVPLQDFDAGGTFQVTWPQFEAVEIP